MQHVMWFRRDLRTFDHVALSTAVREARGEPIIPLFLVDPVEWSAMGAPRRAHLAASLTALRADLGTLHIREGEPVAELAALARRVGPLAVHATADHTPLGRQRDSAAGRALSAAGSRLHLADSGYAVPPGSVVKSDGTPYRVFTPFHRAWLATGCGPPLPRPPRIPTLDPGEGAALPTAPPPAGMRLPAAGEHAARRRWQEYRDDGLEHYDALRDRPDLEATSRLSVHLRWGELHPRTLLADLGESAAHRRFTAELGWREFYADVLYRQPESAHRNLDPAFDRMVHDSGPAAESAMRAWAEGRTGYPLVDAGMRQLRREGWMHNRVRMVAASFLVKDLHLPWWWGAEEFMRWLVDGDVASNSHGWQWVAGCGTDAAPYFRIFNPVTQGLRYDPDGDYVRRHVAELRHLPGPLAHEPWRRPDGAAHGYPSRIVDHGEERAEALRRLEAIR